MEIPGFRYDKELGVYMRIEKSFEDARLKEKKHPDYKFVKQRTILKQVNDHIQVDQLLCDCRISDSKLEASLITPSKIILFHSTPNPIATSDLFAIRHIPLDSLGSSLYIDSILAVPLAHWSHITSTHIHTVDSSCRLHRLSLNGNLDTRLQLADGRADYVHMCGLTIALLTDGQAVVCRVECGVVARAKVDVGVVGDVRVGGGGGLVGVLGGRGELTVVRVGSCGGGGLKLENLVSVEGFGGHLRVRGVWILDKVIRVALHGYDTVVIAEISEVKRSRSRHNVENKNSTQIPRKENKNHKKNLEFDKNHAVKDQSDQEYSLFKSQVKVIDCKTEILEAFEDSKIVAIDRENLRLIELDSNTISESTQKIGKGCYLLNKAIVLNSY